MPNLEGREKIDQGWVGDVSLSILSLRCHLIILSNVSELFFELIEMSVMIGVHGTKRHFRIEFSNSTLFPLLQKLVRIQIAL